MKRKRNAVTIETKLETIDQLAEGARASFLVVRHNIGIVIRLSEKIDYPNHPWSQLVRIIGILLYVQLQCKLNTQATTTDLLPRFLEMVGR